MTSLPSPLLPELPDSAPAPQPVPTPMSQLRVRRPVRNQLEWIERDLDSLMPDDHLARAIWALLEQLDLSAFYAEIQAVIGGPGRPASDPQVLLALWVYATTQGEGSAREVARLCREHDAYRWLRGGVPVDYHLLSDFRAAPQETVDEMMTQVVALLANAGLVTLGRVSQDGMRVRASAGAASFRRKERLEGHLEQARARVAELQAQREQPESGVSKRQQAARERAAREREERVSRALEALPALQAIKDAQQTRHDAQGKKRPAKEARASTADPEARVMKMADGGFRPAYNVQFATDVGSGVIVGTDVVTTGSDAGQAGPMVEQVKRRTGRLPKEYLVDGGFVSLDGLTHLAQQGITVYAPPPAPRKGRNPAEPRPGDAPEVAEWRERMGSEDGKAVYRQRASSAEWSNAQARVRYGLHQFMVRGRARVRGVVNLLVLTHDLLRWMALLGAGQERGGPGTVGLA